MDSNVRKNRDIIAKIEILYSKLVILKSKTNLLYKMLTILCFYLTKRTHDEHRSRVTRLGR
jgi:hypothetical protein